MTKRNYKKEWEKEKESKVSRLIKIDKSIFEELKNKYQFFSSLLEINSVFADNQEFVNQIKNELFSDKVYIYGMNGRIVELPKGSTVIDYAFNLDSDIGNTMVGAIVNDDYNDVGDFHICTYPFYC